MFIPARCSFEDMFVGEIPYTLFSKFIVSTVITSELLRINEAMILFTSISSQVSNEHTLVV